MEIHEGKFSVSNSDLYIIIYAIYYQDCSYIHADYALICKSNGMQVEGKKAKIYKKNIQHWEPYETSSNT